MDILTRSLNTCTPVNWIASNGSQYIDTGIILTANSRVIISYRHTAWLNTGEAKIGGGADTRSSGLYGISIGRIVNNVIPWAFNAVRPITPTITRADALNTDLIDTIDLSAKTYTVLRNGVTSSVTIPTPAGYVGTSKVYLFKDNSAAYPYPAIGRIYYFKVFESGTLIQHLVPYVVNGTACMRDLISGAFYTNKGTGAFSYA